MKRDQASTSPLPKYHELKDTQITLRTTKVADYPQLGAILNDKTTMEALIPHFKTDTWTEEMVRLRYEKFQKNQYECTGLHYSVIQNSNRRIVGSCSFKHISTKEKSAEFGIILDKSVWGMGVARACHFLCLRHAFDVLKLFRIYFMTDEHHLRMKGFFSKYGILLKGKSPEGYLDYEVTTDAWNDRVRQRLEKQQR